MYQYAPDHNAVFTSPDGRVDWRFKTGGRIGGALSIVGNVLYVESFDKTVYALDAQIGRQLWHTSLPNIAMNAPPLVSNGLVYVGTGNNTILSDNYETYIEGIPAGDRVMRSTLLQVPSHGRTTPRARTCLQELSPSPERSRHSSSVMATVTSGL